MGMKNIVALSTDLLDVLRNLLVPIFIGEFVHQKGRGEVGSGAETGLVCLRVHPTFKLLHPIESFVSFTSIDGSKHEVWPESGEQVYEGNLLLSGEWMLIDKCHGLGLVNRFNVNEVFKCLIHWGTGTFNLELWSENRPVSKQSPPWISHVYEVIEIP
ncbi:hypothetical protein FH972_012656 [Carpinus fangiana]|uniref:Uncharacterized protein n=1 Tax=Carpinus fangiana TaxID=176857 RepID=A0A5N6R7M5_9ROSI|nr:hypothetical protein FH972_012656 [Carpinus fangiana]